jgi:hypothetical protein
MIYDDIVAYQGVKVVSGNPWDSREKTLRMASNCPDSGYDRVGRSGIKNQM